MRWSAKVDANQVEIVRALRQAGATITHLHAVGRGCPDIIAGYNGKNYLLEIKTNAGRMTPLEEDFLHTWRGQVAVVRTAEEALNVIQEKLYETTQQSQDA